MAFELLSYPDDLAVSPPCLICSQTIASGVSGLETSVKKSREVLNQLARLLSVSSSIYYDTDLESLPEPLICSTCRRTVSSAIILQENLESVREQLRSLTQIIMKDFIRSYKTDVGGSVTFKDDRNTLRRIRKTYVQCFAPCEVRIAAIETQPGLILPQSSVNKIHLNPKSDMQTWVTNEAEPEIKIESGDLGFEKDDVWEGEHSLGVSTLAGAELVDNIVEVETSPSADSPPNIYRSSKTIAGIIKSHSPSTLSKSRETNLTVTGKSGITFEIDFDDEAFNSDDGSEYKPNSSCDESPAHSPQLRAASKTQFKCQECDKNFPSFVSLYTHRSRTHGRRKHKMKQENKKAVSKYTRLFKCNLCSRRFHRNSLLEKHLKSHVGSSNRFKCSFCTDIFDTPRQMKTHLLEIHKDETKKFPCTLCGFIFTRKYSLRTHMKLHKGEKDFPCKSCGNRFPFYADFRSHACGKARFPCSICGKSFTRNYALRLHVQRHNGIDKLHCQPCNKKFETSDEHVHHIKWHAAGCPPEKESPTECQFKCPICNQGYDFKHAFDYHMEKHTKPDELVTRYIKAVRDDYKNVISFTCDVCKEEFSEAAYLNNESQFQIVCQHGNCPCKDTFTDLSKFMHHHGKICTLAYRRHRPQQRLCEECGKDFSNEQYLLKHIRRCHPKNEKFNCQECGKIFGQKNLLDTHFATHHSTETPHQCHICGKGFKTKYSVNGHLRKLHGYECNYACERCGKKFKTLNYLSNHLKTHEDDQEKCHLCGKVFKSKTHVWHHVYNTHERRRPPRKKAGKKEAAATSSKKKRTRRSPGKLLTKRRRPPAKENTNVIIDGTVEFQDVKLISIDELE